jgi:hypothetical protein
MGEENPNIHKYVADKKIKYYFVGKFSVKLKIVFANSTVKIFTKFLATHLRFLATHKCVATPSLRTTALNRYFWVSQNVWRSGLSSILGFFSVVIERFLAISQIWAPSHSETLFSDSVFQCKYSNSVVQRSKKVKKSQNNQNVFCFVFCFSILEDKTKQNKRSVFWLFSSFKAG